MSWQHFRLAAVEGELLEVGAQPGRRPGDPRWASVLPGVLLRWWNPGCDGRQLRTGVPWDVAFLPENIFALLRELLNVRISDEVNI